MKGVCKREGKNCESQRKELAEEENEHELLDKEVLSGNKRGDFSYQLPVRLCLSMGAVRAKSTYIS